MMNDIFFSVTKELLGSGESSSSSNSATTTNNNNNGGDGGGEKGDDDVVKLVWKPINNEYKNMNKYPSFLLLLWHQET